MVNDYIKMLYAFEKMPHNDYLLARECVFNGYTQQ